MVTPARSRNHENDGLSGFPNMNSESYQSKMKQNNSIELLSYSFNNIYNKNDPPDPLDPKPGFFAGLSIGNLLFLEGHIKVFGFYFFRPGLSIGNQFFLLLQVCFVYEWLVQQAIGHGHGPWVRAIWSTIRLPAHVRFARRMGRRYEAGRLTTFRN